MNRLSIWNPDDGIHTAMDTMPEPCLFELKARHAHGVRVDRSLARPCGAWCCSRVTPLGTTFCELARVKDELLAALLENTADPRLREGLCRAAEEAAAIAWTTSYPLLVFPVLLEEKATQARHYRDHQRWIWNYTRTYYMDALSSAQ